MKGRKRRLRNGFTLIDLLVVLALIGLIVPLLSSIIRDADQRAGVATCLSNLGGMMRATSMYLEDYDNEFLFYVSGENSIATWRYGGQTNDSYWRTSHGGTFYYPVTARPLNPYLLGVQPEPDAYVGNELVARTPVPQVRCPADRFSYVRGFVDPGEGPRNMSSYDDVGASYHTNLHALDDVDWNGDRDPWHSPGTWQDRGQLLLLDVLAGQADTFTWYLEDPMDWSIYEDNKTIVVGNHGDFGKHSCGYLDGHGDYAYRDTRGWCSPGWEAIVTQWIKYGGHTPKPAHYWGWPGKNCQSRQTNVGPR